MLLFDKINKYSYFYNYHSTIMKNLTQSSLLPLNYFLLSLRRKFWRKFLIPCIKIIVWIITVFLMSITSWTSSVSKTIFSTYPLISIDHPYAFAKVELIKSSITLPNKRSIQIRFIFKKGALNNKLFLSHPSRIS